jgi:hypothetical protein
MRQDAKSYRVNFVDSNEGKSIVNASFNAAIATAVAVESIGKCNVRIEHPSGHEVSLRQAQSEISCRKRIELRV